MKLHAALCAAALAAASASDAAALTLQSYEVVRLGDSQLSCEALAADMTAIRSEIAEMDRRARDGAQARQSAGRLGRGLLSGLARGAAAMGYGGNLGDGAGGALATQAIAGVASEIANAPPAAEPPAESAASPQDSPRHQRLAHLTALFQGRAC